MPAETERPSQVAEASSRNWIRQHWNWCLSGIVAAVCIVMLLAGVLTIRPHYYEQDKADARKLVEQFHARWNAAQFDDIYNDADESLQSYPGGREGLVAALQGARTQFGSFEAVTSSQMNVLPRGVIEVRAVYHDRFERGDVSEAFIFVMRKDKFRLSHFEIYRDGVKRPD